MCDERWIQDQIDDAFGSMCVVVWVIFAFAAVFCLAWWMIGR